MTGTRVICIEATGVMRSGYLTPGRLYNVEKIDSDYVYVIDDSGHQRGFWKARFKADDGSVEAKEEKADGTEQAR